MNGAHDFLVTNSTFIDQSTHVTTIVGGLGLGRLRARSIPEASHDSSARYPPPSCHPGTREHYIKSITEWTASATSMSPLILWLKGPAGVGKSAIAQTCAEVLEEKLGASFFLSRANGWDDPRRLFTSIAYQLAMKSKVYGDLLDELIHRDPTILEKSMPSQFRELLVTPFHALTSEPHGLSHCLIIIDGLDECAGIQAQQDIINIIGRSARENSTPFLWLICSRLEPHLVATFSKPEIQTATLEIELTISRHLDREISIFLTDQLAEIAKRYGVKQPWPAHEDVWRLVELAAGLFAYAYTVVRFIDDEESKEPPDRLATVLALRHHVRLGCHINHPLDALHSLYTFVLTRVPRKSLTDALQILLVNRLLPHLVKEDAMEEGFPLAVPSIPIPVTTGYLDLLDLTDEAFEHSLRCLHAVTTTEDATNTRFCHASFLDFLEDQSRSKEFCIWSDTSVVLCNKLLDKFDEVYMAKGPFRGTYPRIPGSRKDTHLTSLYYHLSRAFISLLELADLNVCRTRLKAFDFRKLCLAPLGYLSIRRVDKFIENTQKLGLLQACPSRNFKNLLLTKVSRRPKCHSYVIGSGEGKILITVSYNREIGSEVIEVEPWSVKGLERLKTRL
ncbi:hypothetical protein NP233_g6251 [Leucocoprinus birnbaumii]|uniref:Nephrocystin 3-like N-terminal domain-containing protein n=1 Tax=Leucocoprinus birnbaumii TaxID=56174 RepID=A0AAD5YVQ2_9AGAR|nr:hypothetical protein NP233_g6251 [Leucocoprinus birnbaumii]